MNDWIYFFFFKLLNHTHLLLSLNLICLYSCGVFELHCFPLWGHVRVLYSKPKAKTNKNKQNPPCSSYRIELQSQFSSGYLLRKRWPHLSAPHFQGSASASGDDCICSMGSGEGSSHVLKVNFWTVCYKTQSHWFLMHGLDSHFFVF